MGAFQETCRAAGRPENVVGWYHSHPGYGCWLSGIDVQTQLTNQRYQVGGVVVVVVVGCGLCGFGVRCV